METIKKLDISTEVLVPMGEDGKPQCDIYSCNIMYDKTVVEGDPVQYCNNGTGKSIGGAGSGGGSNFSKKD